MPYQADKHEKEILDFWQKHQIFERSVNERPESKPYVFYDGPPFATGLPHYGHILSSVIKDLVPRYWTMKGYKVRRRWGWDCHGLPIESLIEKELKISGKKDVEERIGVKEFNDACRATVLMYAGEWKKMVERISRWVEFDNSYKTMDVTYMESVWWALKTIWDKGLIYEGRKVLMYCPHCETPVAKAEVAMDHSYREVTEESVIVKFQISNPSTSSGQVFKFQIDGVERGQPVYLLAWTTTPWTLPGNVALAVGEDIDYVLLHTSTSGNFNVSGSHVWITPGYYIVARERKKEVNRGGNYFSQIKTIKGKDLIGLEYQPLFDMPAMKQAGKKVYYIAAGDFVTTVEGTGIVHTAVLYGEDDYNFGVKLDLPMVPMLDSRGHYNAAAPEFIRGQYYKKAEKEIKRYLDENKLIFAKEPYTHAYPHCWRCDTPLIYNAVSAWFINIQKVKDRMIKLNEKISWYPEHLKHGRFLNIVKEAPDWNISRNRYWATVLPFWRHKNTENKKTKKQCDQVVCLGSIEELKEKAVNFDAVFKSTEVDLHKHLMDQIVLKCDGCGGEMRRVPEVLDCWFEAASMPFAEFHYPFENKAEFEARFPAQYIAEYIGQVRAWFYYMHAVAALLFDEISFENSVVTGNVLNEKGEKLSKSKKNYPDPWHMIEVYGVDAIRFYLMTSVVMQADDLFFNEREVREKYNKVVNILWNVVEFFKQNSTNYKSKIINHKSEHVLDRWILARLDQLVQEVTTHMDNYDTVRAGRLIEEFIDDLSTWYVRRSRERFKTLKHDVGDDAQAAVETLRSVLLILSKLMAPFTPFIAEKIYQEVGKGKREKGKGNLEESVHLESWPVADGKLIDDKLIADMARARKIVEMGLALRKEQGIRVRQPLSQMQISKCKMQNGLLAIVADELNVKEVREVKDVTRLPGHWVGTETSEMDVALNIDITPKLKQEGLLREIIRAINQIRKEAKLTPQDEIVIAYNTNDPDVKVIFREFSDEIRRQTRTKEFVADGQTRRDIGGPQLKLDLRLDVQTQLC